MSPACRLRHRVGFRGAFLVTVGAFDVYYGWTKLISPRAIDSSPEQLRLLAEVFPLGAERASIVTWGLLWWITAVFCFVSAFRQEDRWGFGMAIGLKVGWLLGNGYAWANGLPGGGSTVGVWAFVLVVVVLISMWAEPSPNLEALIDDMHDADQADQVADQVARDDRADRAEVAEQLDRAGRAERAERADVDRGTDDGA